MERPRGEAQGRDEAWLLRASSDQRGTFDLCLEGGKVGSRKELLWTLSPQGQQLPPGLCILGRQLDGGGCSVRV